MVRDRCGGRILPGLSGHTRQHRHGIPEGDLRVLRMRPRIRHQGHNMEREDQDAPVGHTDHARFGTDRVRGDNRQSPRGCEEGKPDHHGIRCSGRRRLESQGQSGSPDEGQPSSHNDKRGCQGDGHIHRRPETGELSEPGTHPERCARDR